MGVENPVNEVESNLSHAVLVASGSRSAGREFDLSGSWIARFHGRGQCLIHTIVGFLSVTSAVRLSAGNITGAELAVWNPSQEEQHGQKWCAQRMLRAWLFEAFTLTCLSRKMRLVLGRKEYKFALSTPKCRHPGCHLRRIDNKECGGACVSHSPTSSPSSPPRTL